MTIQLPTSTAKPAAILTHMVRSAFGEISLSAKNLSRRRRKTLGKEDTLVGSPIDCRDNASDGTRSSISGFRVITASASAVTGASAIMFSRSGASRIGGIGGRDPQRFDCPRRRQARNSMLARKLKQNQGNSDQTELPWLVSACKMMAHHIAS